MLRMSQQDVGKLARCPKCQATFTVPEQQDGDEQFAQTDVLPPAKWYVRIEDGTEYGPVSSEELGCWFQEGRVTSSCMLRSDEWDDWLSASEVIPSLGKIMDKPAGVPKAANRPNIGSNPYASPTVATVARPDEFISQPHRGGTILVLGILGLFCCNVLGVAAWIMGSNDLRDMNANRMDASGRGITQIGMVVGIIATIRMVIKGFAHFANLG